MALEATLEIFKQACLAIAPNSRFTSYTMADLEPIAKHLPLSEDIYEWYSLSAPLKVSIDWTANDLDLFEPNNLLEYQIGYRWQSQIRFDHNKLEKMDDWHDEWLVIAWIGGDPIIAKVNEKPNPILMAYHGMGYWKPDVVSPNLESFLKFLTQWCKLVEEYKTIQNMLDEDSVILPEVFERLGKITKQTVGEPFSENLMKYLWG